MTVESTNIHPAWTGWLRLAVFIVGVVVICCGVVLLLQWIEHPETKVHPRLAFWGSLVLQWCGMAIATFALIGWPQYISSVLKHGGKWRVKDAEVEKAA